MKKPRHLSPEDRAVWEAVAKRVTPLHPARPSWREPAPLPKPSPAKPEKPALKPFAVGEKVTPPAASTTLGPTLAKAPVQMDAKAYGKMARGKLKPEARIDLHGMTLSDAHPALIRFILNAQATGLRLVLVITGKGKATDDGSIIPQRRGILRHQVPQWLRLAPLAGAILEVRPAHRRHGGDGAFYVYLRRNR